MVDYNQVLADLEARRASLVADLDASIRTVRQILQASGQQPQQPQRPHFRPPTGGAENQTKLVFDFLVKEAPRAKGPKDVATGTGLPEKAVRGILSRLAKSKKIDRPGRGKFRGKAQAQEAAAA